MKEKITTEFSDKGFWIEDQFGDAEDISDIEHNIIAINFVEIDKKKKSAIVAVSVETTFSADIVYDDFETAIYDSEDKNLIPMQKIYETVEQTVEYTSIVTVSFNESSFNIETISIEEEDFPITIDNNYS